MHSSPATVHPEKVLEAEIFSEPGVQYLHGHHHVPAVQVKKVGVEKIPPPALGTDFGATAAVADVVVVSQVNVEN